MSGDTQQPPVPGADATTAVAPADAYFEPSDLGLLMADDLVDNASVEADDPNTQDDIDESEFDDDNKLDALEEFMSDDPEEIDDFDDPDLVDAELLGTDVEFDDVDEPSLRSARGTKDKLSDRAVEARRAIEERAEARRLEKDFDYLDFDLDD